MLLPTIATINAIVTDSNVFYVRKTYLPVTGIGRSEGVVRVLTAGARMRARHVRSNRSSRENCARRGSARYTDRRRASFGGTRTQWRRTAIGAGRPAGGLAGRTGGASLPGETTKN